MGSFSIWHWLIVLVVVVVLFGGRGKLSSIMGDAANFGIHFAVLKRWRHESPQRSLAPAVWQAWRTVSSLRMSSSREANCSASERCRTPEALC